MATTYKVLGQVAPADSNNANLYTVPSATQAVVSTLHVANVTSEEAFATIYVRIAGAAAANSNAIAKDLSVLGNSVVAITTGVTLGPADVVTIKSSSPNSLTFSLFGSEIA